MRVWRLKPELNKVEQALTEPESMRLLRELENLPKDAISHKRRRNIGDRLAVIGDTREGVVVKDGIPDIVWRPVLGSGEPVILKTSEREIDPVTILNFYVAKYLITCAQFQAFVDAEDGFYNLLWWDKFSEEYRSQERMKPRAKMKNEPHDSQSWYDSVAFSRWMNHRCRGVGIACCKDDAGVVYGYGRPCSYKMDRWRECRNSPADGLGVAVDGAGWGVRKSLSLG